jgi:Phage Terminase
MKQTISLPPESRTDPVQFMRTFLTDVNGKHADPHPGQEQILRNIQPLTVGCCGRQFGKSITYDWYGTWFGANHVNKEIYVIAPTVDQSRIIFNEIAGHFRKPPLNSLVRGKIKQYPFPELNLSNGTNVYGCGANSPEFIRGKKIHLALLDEAAFFKDGVIRSVIEPMFIMTEREQGSALIMIFTPFGMGS